MANDRFEPKLGGTTSKRAPRNVRVFKLVAQEAGKSLHKGRGRAEPLTSRPIAELARGKGSFHAVLPPRPGMRRVIVKARVARHGTSDLGAARAHQHYILRDGVNWDGEAGQLYDRDHDDPDGSDFLSRQKGDRYQFRFIVSPEDSARMSDLKPFVRDLMRGMEQDLRTELDWVAVDHSNTGHPHTHIIVRGRDDQGQDLVMARHYISHGIRNRARELVTLELGPETELEQWQKLYRAMEQERFTMLDRGILSAAKDNVLTLSAAPEPDAQRHAFRIGRLRMLEKMGVAEEKQTGVWTIDAGLETKLRRMGERGDKMATMFRVMREAGPDRAAGDYAIFDGAGKRESTIGKVVGVGLADEVYDRQYVVVDGIDGSVHYAETSKLAPEELPGRGMIVALSGSGGKGRVGNVRIEVLSYWELERLPGADALTWLDKKIVENKEMPLREHGFGAKVKAAMAARKEWLLSQQLATRAPDGGVTAKPGLVADLINRDLDRVEMNLAQQTGIPSWRPMPDEMVRGRYEQTIVRPTMKLAVLRSAEGMTMVPWKPALELHRGREIMGHFRGRTIELVLGRGRGLSRSL
jgi:type IV secretory pathway VirD2 relaxase